MASTTNGNGGPSRGSTRNMPTSSPGGSSTGSGIVTTNGGARVDGIDTPDPSVHFSSELFAAIAEIVPSRDPLDNQDFNPVDYINELFPNEQSLVDVDQTVSKLNMKITRLDAETLNHVRGLSKVGSRGKQDLATAKDAIEELFEKINDIKTKAEQSEQMVQEICRDIKSLDYAKRHLTTTITALKRIQMLVTGVEQLKVMESKGQFREVGNLLEAVKQLSLYFEEYEEIPRIRELNRTIDDVTIHLRKQIYTDFRKLDRAPQQGVRLANTAKLSDLCFVVDALGSEIRGEFVKWFCTNLLREYKSSFRPGDESSSLEYVDRRYAWCMRELRKYDAHYADVFPKMWKVDETLVEEFSLLSKERLTSVLEESRGITLDVKLLLLALQRTLDFEKEMCERFVTNAVPEIASPEEIAALMEEAATDMTSEGKPDDEHEEDGAAAAAAAADAAATAAAEEERIRESEWNPPSSGGGMGTMSDDDAFGNTEENPHSAAAIKRRWMKFQKEKEAEQQKEEAPSAAQAATPKRRKQIAQKFRGIISAAFHPFMSLYIEQEDTYMTETMTAALEQETWSVDEDEANKFLESSKEMILMFRKSMKRCEKINRDAAFFDLYKLFRTHLKSYCRAIHEKLIKLAPGGEQQVRLGEKHEKTACLILNTAEYCADTMSHMADSIRNTISHTYASKVKLDAEREIYLRVADRAGVVLRKGLETKLEAPLLAMQRYNWGSWESVGDQSDYVNQVSTILSQSIPLFNTWLSKTYFRMFRDEFVKDFIGHLINCIYKCRRISEVGAEQLLMDMTAVKSVLISIPTMGGAADATPPPRYVKYVKTELGRAEKFLKVIMNPMGAVVGSYLTLIPDGGEKTLVKILDLKGIAKQNQGILLEAFRRSRRQRSSGTATTTAATSNPIAAAASASTSS